MDEFPQVRFYTIGAMIQQIKKRFGPRYTTGFGDHDIYKWVEMMPEMLGDVDFYAVPLLDMTYTRAKSSVKFLEMSSTTVPGVWQDIRQYQEVVKHGKNGFLAKSEGDWYKGMKRLCESVELRRKMGQAAFKTVKQDWTIQKNIYRHVDFFKHVLDN
jgi:glycosyltransferase involved in cell wall biosynthesis